MSCVAGRDHNETIAMRYQNETIATLIRSTAVGNRYISPLRHSSNNLRSRIVATARWCWSDAVPATMGYPHQPFRGHQAQRNRDSKIRTTLTGPGLQRASGRTEGLASTTKCGECEAPPSQKPPQGAAIRGEGGMLRDAVVNGLDDCLPFLRKERLTPSHADQGLLHHHDRAGLGCAQDPVEVLAIATRDLLIHQTDGSEQRTATHHDGGRMRLHGAVANQSLKLDGLRSRYAFNLLVLVLHDDPGHAGEGRG